MNIIDLKGKDYTGKSYNGHFNCASKKDLTSLKGAPRKVSGNFICFNNNLTSLEGAPLEVGGDFDCEYNKLTSLEGAPLEVGRKFSCFNNPDLPFIEIVKYLIRAEIVGNVVCNYNHKFDFTRFKELNNRNKIKMIFEELWQN